MYKCAHIFLEPFHIRLSEQCKTICRRASHPGLSHVRHKGSGRTEGCLNWRVGWRYSESRGNPRRTLPPGSDGHSSSGLRLGGSLLTTYVTDLAMISSTMSSALQYLPGRIKGRMKEISDSKGAIIGSEGNTHRHDVAKSTKSLQIKV